MKKNLRLFTLPLLLALTACTGPKDVAPKSSPYQTPTSGSASAAAPEPSLKVRAEAKTYLERAATANAQQSYVDQVQAAEIYIDSGNPLPAKQIIYHLSTWPVQSNDPAIQAQIATIEAKIALTENKPKEATRVLEKIPSTTNLSSEQQEAIAHLNQQAYLRSNRLVDSARAQAELLRNQTSQSTSTKTSEEVKTLWQILQQLNTTQLQSVHQNASLDPIAPWSQLAWLNKAHQDNLPDLERAIAQWKSYYPHLNTAPIIPPQLNLEDVNQTRLKNKHFTNIALLLPLTGSLSSTAIAIRDGLMTAHFANPQEAQRQILIYDTQEDKAVNEAYQQAVNAGADIVIGPLTKPGVEALAKTSNNAIPMLALNTIELPKGQLPNHFFQFGLIPEKEAEQVAHRAWQDGRQRAVILVPDNAWGQRLGSAFSRTWQTLGGTVITFQTFPTNGAPDDAIKATFGLNESEARFTALRDTLHLKIEGTPRRRQDIDMIFLAANPHTAQQMNPLFDFYYAANVPVYSTSSVFTGETEIQNDPDLNGIFFCDMPWLFDPQHPQAGLRTTIIDLWPESSAAYLRFYALGIDAYLLITQLARLEELPLWGVRGTTGTLTLNDLRQLERQLSCAQWKNGKPHLITYPTF